MTNNIRQTMCQKRMKLNKEILYQRSHQIADLFINTTLFKKAKIIASFKAIAGEQNPKIINQITIQQGKLLLLPIIKNFTNKMSFGDSNQNFITNKFNILEPKNRCMIPLWLFDIVLVPLTAFDKHGNRLGFGGGFYDHTFDFIQWHSHRPLLIGVAHEFQQTKNLSPNSWDIPLDGILTECRLDLF